MLRRGSRASRMCCKNLFPCPVILSPPTADEESRLLSPFALLRVTEKTRTDLINSCAAPTPSLASAPDGIYETTCNLRRAEWP